MRIGRWTYRAAPNSTFTAAAPDSSTPTASSPHPVRDTSTSTPPVSMNTADNARSTPAAGSRATRFTIATRKACKTPSSAGASTSLVGKAAWPLRGLAVPCSGGPCR